MGATVAGSIGLIMLSTDDSDNIGDGDPNKLGVMVKNKNEKRPYSMKDFVKIDGKITEDLDAIPGAEPYEREYPNSREEWV